MQDNEHIGHRLAAPSESSALEAMLLFSQGMGAGAITMVSAVSANEGEYGLAIAGGLIALGTIYTAVQTIQRLYQTAQYDADHIAHPDSPQEHSEPS